MVSPVGGPAHVWSQGGKLLPRDFKLAAEGTLVFDLQPHVDAVGVVGVAALQGLQILGQIWKKQHPITLSISPYKYLLVPSPASPIYTMEPRYPYQHPWKFLTLPSYF